MIGQTDGERDTEDGVEIVSMFQGLFFFSSFPMCDEKELGKL